MLHQLCRRNHLLDTTALIDYLAGRPAALISANMRGNPVNVSRCCNAGINSFLSNKGSGTVHTGPHLVIIFSLLAGLDSTVQQDIMLLPGEGYGQVQGQGLEESGASGHSLCGLTILFFRNAYFAVPYLSQPYFRQQNLLLPLLDEYHKIQ